MELVQYVKSDADRDEAVRVLNYQPFLIGEDIQTGAAYSWVGWRGDPRTSPPLVFKRAEYDDAEWARVSAANRGLAALYDDYVRAIADRFPGGSLLDVACNNGYIPVAAELAGMRGCAGLDLGSQYGESVGFLNRILGTNVGFHATPYRPETGDIPLAAQFDVVAAMAIMCHLPNPLRFLAALGARADKAIFFWGQILDTEEIVVAHWRPHASLSDANRFPFSFNDNTRVSVGALREAGRQMGFPRMEEIASSNKAWMAPAEPPTTSLEDEIRNGSKHRAFLLMR